MSFALLRPVYLLSALFFFLTACEEYPEYSLAAYTQATEMKAKSLSLLAKASDPYSKHVTEAEALKLDMDVAYEFSAGIEANNEAADMWNIIRDPRENSVGGFLRLWRDDFPRGLSPAFVEAFDRDVRFAYDRLICLESNKREPSACAPLP